MNLTIEMNNLKWHGIDVEDLKLSDKAIMIGNPAWLFPHKANKHMVPLPTCYATTTTYNINIPQRQRNLKLPSINTYSNREENVQENRSSELSRREKRHITGAKKKKKKKEHDVNSRPKAPIPRI